MRFAAAFLLLLSPSILLAAEVPAAEGELVAIAAPAGAPRTVAEAVERLRAPRASIIEADNHGTDFLIAAAGSLPGNFGTFFRSEITIANFRGVPQRIGVAWLAQNINNAGGALQYFTIAANTWSTDSDFVANRLNRTGFGALLVFGVTATGDLDLAARIDGFSRIWTNQPGSAAGTTSQTMAAVSQQESSGRAEAFAGGLRAGGNFRSNVGIVNLDNVTHIWTISAGSSSFTLAVPPYSVNQAPVPATIQTSNGLLGLVFETTASGFWWSAYASSVDNTTGDGWVSRAIQ